MSDFTFGKIHTAYSAQVYWMLSLCKISPVKIQCNYFCEYAVSIFKKYVYIIRTNTFSAVNRGTTYLISTHN